MSKNEQGRTAVTVTKSIPGYTGYDTNVFIAGQLKDGRILLADGAIIPAQLGKHSFRGINYTLKSAVV